MTKIDFRPSSHLKGIFEDDHWNMLRVITDMTPAGTKGRRIPRTRWMDAVNKHMNMAGPERKMAHDRNDGDEPSLTITATPDDGTSQRKRRRSLFTNIQISPTSERRNALYSPNMLGSIRMRTGTNMRFFIAMRKGTRNPMIRSIIICFFICGLFSRLSETTVEQVTCLITTSVCRHQNKMLFKSNAC